MTDQIVLSQDDQKLLFLDARTPNNFTDEPVTDEQLQAVYDLVKWAPTSMNQQPLRILAVRSEEKRDALVEAMMAGNKPKTRTAPVTLIFAADKDFHSNLSTQFPANPNAEAMFEGFGREGRDASARLNAALSIAYWILGVRAAGLQIGPMTGFDVAAVDKEFFPDGRHTALVVANVGHADPESYYPRGPRLAYDQVVTTV